jgi:hypothetical protein
MVNFQQKHWRQTRQTGAYIGILHLHQQHSWCNQTFSNIFKFLGGNVIGIFTIGRSILLESWGQTMSQHCGCNEMSFS